MKNQIMRNFNFDENLHYYHENFPYNEICEFRDLNENLNEGLLYAHPYKNVINILSNAIPCNCKSSYDKLSGIIEISFTSINSAELNILISNLENAINISGWYFYYGIFNGEIFNYLEYLKPFKNGRCALLFREGKISRNAYKAGRTDITDDVIKYDYIYHLTDKKYLKRILKYGLIPKKGNKLGNNPECIHLLSYLTHHGPIFKIDKNGKDFYIKYAKGLNIENPVILKIDTLYLKQTNCIFFKDPGCRPEHTNAIITFSAIHPNAINVVSEDEFKNLYNNQIS